MEYRSLKSRVALRNRRGRSLQCTISGRMAEISKIIRKQQSKLVDTLARKSHFKQDEVEGLLALYRKLSEGAEVDRLDRTRFRHLDF